MKRRIFAWALLAGFVLLLLNVMFIKFYWQLSMALYLIIAFAFLMYNTKATRAREADNLRSSMDGKDDATDSEIDSFEDDSTNNSNKNK